MDKVVILGGGIAGMSAAHELVERGFEVEVYEVKDIPGGKARSINVPNSAEPGKRPLPGEHGFRFFPSFYKHVTDTMKRIPYSPPHSDRSRTVFDNLVDTTELALAQLDKEIIRLPDRFPRSCHDWELIMTAFVQGAASGIPHDELKFFAQRLHQIVTSCPERRIGEYEKISWWDYLDAGHKSPAFQALLARGLTTSLVASRAELASTKTIGDIFIQLLLGIIDPNTGGVDRILNGPTNDVWIEPWLKYLTQRGVKYHLSHRLRHIETSKDAKGVLQITGVTVTDMDNKTDVAVTGDYYIAALPVEIMAGLISKDLATGDPTLAYLRRLGTSTAWMNGIQFYTKDDISVAKGHVLYVDSPWALTSVSQPNFWPEFPMSEFGKGEAKGLMSVISSNWGYFIDPNTDEVSAIKSVLNEDLKIEKPPQLCTPEEIKTEIWKQMKKSLKEKGALLLEDEQILDWFLDPDIVNSCHTLANNRDELIRVLDRDFPDYFKDLFLWIHDHKAPSVTLEEIANYLKVDQSQARLAVNALIAKGYVGPIPLPEKETEKKALTSSNLFYRQPSDKRLCYHSRLRETDANYANVNGEPLLVNLVNTWHLRPNAHTKIPNLFLASDYVRTNTDLATMEGANEAARRAVNSIIDASGSKVAHCKIWKLRQPASSAIWRWSDRQRYQKGLPWNGKVSPWYLWLLFPIMMIVDFVERLLLRFR